METRKQKPQIKFILKGTALITPESYAKVLMVKASLNWIMGITTQNL